MRPTIALHVSSLPIGFLLVAVVIGCSSARTVNGSEGERQDRTAPVTPPTVSTPRSSQSELKPPASKAPKANAASGDAAWQADAREMLEQLMLVDGTDSNSVGNSNEQTFCEDALFMQAVFAFTAKARDPKADAIEATTVALERFGAVAANEKLCVAVK